MMHGAFTRPEMTQSVGITPNSSVRSTMETLANAVSELQKTFGELRDRVQPIVENVPSADQCGVPSPARLSPNACALCCAIDSEAERVERLAGEMYRLAQSIQL